VSVTVFGSINMDVVMPVARLPRAGETVAASGMRHLPGGKGANQAVASARFGAGTRMIGAVGEDGFGDAMLAFLADEAVAIDAVARCAGPTGIAHVFVSDEGENQIVIVAGANGLLAAPERWTAGTAPGRAIALAQLETPLPAVAAFLAQARAARALTILNAAPALAAARPLLAAADLLVVNETELAFFLAIEPPENAGAAVDAARRLARDDDQWVVVTLGAKGIIAVRGEETLAVPAPHVAVVDTTGAGDTFCGVLAACLSEEMAMAAALRHACAAASLSVQRVGAAPSMPRRAEVEGMTL
jgi:ribokinase